MANDLNTEIKIGADASGVEAGVGRAKRSLADLGQSAKKAGQDAGAGIGAIGAGGEKASKDVERATRNIQGQLQRAVASFEAGERGSRKFYESLARQRGADLGSLKPLLDQLDAYKSKTDAVSVANTKASSSFTSLGVAAGIAARAVAAIGIGASLGEFVKLADASTNVSSRLSLVTTSAAELASVQQRLFQVAQSSRVSFVDLVGTYAQVARSTKDLGVSQTALLGVIQTISQAVTISGGSAASAQAALTQLSQGFASGALRGEELNSILEQTPRLAQALADGLGVGVGKLRELGQAGALTSEAVLGALEKSAAGVAAEFGKMAVTVEQASTQAANSALKLVGALDKITGASAATAGGITRLSAGMDGLTLNIERLASSKGLGDFFFLAFNNERSLNGELAITQKELATLEARLARAPSDIYTRSAVADMREYVKELKEAQARLAALSGQAGPTDPRDQSGFTGRGTSYANEAARQSKLREDANKFRLDQAGVPASYLKDMAELIRLNQAGVIVGKEYNDALKKQQDILLQKTGVTKGAAAAANQEQNAYETLVASIRTKIAANEAEISGAGRLTESDKLRIKLQEELAAGAKTLTAEHKARALALLDILGAQEKEEARIKGLVAAYKQEAETAEEIARAYTAQSKAREAGRAGVDAYANGIDESNKSLQLELSLMGQSEQARSVALEQYRIELDLKKQLAAINENIGFNEAQREEERAKARAAAAIATANASSRAFLDEWKQSVNKYDDIFRQGFADMLNNGQDGWKSFTRSLATTFKTTVADQIYKMFAQPFVMKLVASLIGITGGGIVGTAASAVSGGSGILSTASSGLGLLTGGLGQGFRAGISGLLGEAGLSGTISAGTTAIGAGNIAGGIGTLLGPLALVGGGLLALNSLLKATKGETRTGGQFGVAFDGSVTNNRRGETYTYQGQQFDRDFSNGQRNALINGQAYRLEGDPVAQESAIRDAVAGTATGINAFLKALGSAATVTGFSAGLETSGKGRGGVFAGGTLSDGTTFGESGKGDNYAGTLYEKFSTNSPDFKTALENFTLDLKQSTIQALQSVTDIPETVKKMLADVDAEGLSEEAANALLESINAQIVGVGQLQSAFEAMGLDELAKMGFDAAAGLAAAAGGFDKLQANLNTYYDNFFTEEEKRANLQKQLDKEFANLGIDVPKTRDEYKRLVEEALGQVEIQQAAKDKLSATISEGIKGSFTIEDLGKTGLLDGIDPALYGGGAANPEVAGKLNDFLKGVNDLAEQGLDPAAFDQSLADLVAMNSEVLGIGKDASTTAAALLRLNGVFAELNESADQTAARIAKEEADARGKAFSALERAIAAEKNALQSQIDIAQDVASTMGDLFDLLHDNVRELYAEVDSTRGFQAEQGNQFIAQALAAARSSGYLPDVDQLAEAISGARGGLGENGFRSGAERDFATLVLAGQLKGLEDITGRQLTDAQRTVKELESQTEQLDKTLTYWREQIDIANGTYEATLSVVDAIKNLESLMFPEVGVNKPDKIGGGGSGGAVFGGSSGSGGGAATPQSKYKRPVSLGTGGVGYVGVSAEEEKRLDQFNSGYRAFDGTGDAAGLAAWIAANQLKPEDLSALSGLYATDWEKWYRENGIPAYEIGTNYVPRTGLAMLHEGEAVVPKAYNPAANPGMGGQSNARLESLVEKLTAEVAELKALQVDSNTYTGQLSDQFDSWTQGGQGTARMEVTNEITVAA